MPLSIDDDIPGNGQGLRCGNILSQPDEIDGFIIDCRLQSIRILDLLNRFILRQVCFIELKMLLNLSVFRQFLCKHTGHIDNSVQLI